MNKSFTSICFALALAAGLVASATSGYAQGAVATISAVTGGGGLFNYTITLQNTGSGNLNSFWYGWTLGGNNLPSIPSNPANSLGWANVLAGNSIEWENTTSSPSLAPGNSATFTFSSPSTLAAMTTAPAGQSVAFTTDTIQFNQGVAGQSTPVFSPTVAPVPEPSVTLLGIASLILAGSFKWRNASRKS